MDLKKRAKQLKMDIPAVFIALKSGKRQLPQKFVPELRLYTRCLPLILYLISYRYWDNWMT